MATTECFKKASIEKYAFQVQNMHLICSESVALVKAEQDLAS